MNYPGNEALAEEIRQRLLNTFRHTLDLAEKGDQREAQLGCDFVLRLDPLFEPARQLNERLKDESGPVAVTDLRTAIGSDDTAHKEAPPASAVDADDLDAPDGLEPTMPTQPAVGADEPVFELDLDAVPEDLDSALDLSSLESSHAQKAPASEPPTPAASTEPVAALDEESEQRVQDLLNEGQAAFDGAEYQSAIDAWSRIFLIDIDHPEAGRRIDLARKLKAEVERKLEETYHDAVGKVESGRLDEARQGFAAVLEMMPGHVAAQEYLARLDAPDFAIPESVAPQQPSPSAGEAFDAPFETEEEVSGEVSDGLDTEIPPPPDPTQAAPLPAMRDASRASKPARASNRTFKTVGAAALVLLTVVGWFLYKNWASFFPNASDEAPTVQLDPITRAKRTYAEAGAAIAVAQIRRLSPGHPQYAEAQALLAQWEAALDASKPKTEEPEPEAVAARDRLVDNARGAVAERQFLLAQELLERAGLQAPLDEAAAEMLQEAKSELAPMQAEIEMFRDGEWELALRNLWRKWEGGTNTPDARRLMVDSYFNLGVRDLQRDDPTAAIANFKEAGDLAGEDAELARLIRFAQTYDSRSDDLLYRIFVKYLPFR